MKLRRLFSSLLISLSVLATISVQAEEFDHKKFLREFEMMKQRIGDLEKELVEVRAVKKELKLALEEAVIAKQTAQEANEKVQLLAKNEASGIDVGGAVRFQYSNERYNEGNKERGGDLDFDTFRLNLDGEIGDVILSAEWRWYQYMDTVHHAWIGYDLSETSQIQAGIQKVPFGVLPFNSHSFFFSSNFYLGLEDDYDAGFKYLYKDGPWDLRLGFYLNDEQGGIDGYVDQREDRYSYDVLGIRASSEGTSAKPATEIAENNTWNARLAHRFELNPEFNVEVGLSGQYGELHNKTEKVGNQAAYAVHLVGNYERWNLQLQATTYEYDVKGGTGLMAVGAYSFFDTIAAEADTYTANLAYSLPVKIGPITNLTFYNDYSLVTNKSADLDDTWMNVLGMAVSAGGLYTYFDYVMAENQPFVGGTMGKNGNTEHRFNVNMGYYF